MPACHLPVADGCNIQVTRPTLPSTNVAKPFRISAPAITRHLQVLENAGLIEKRVDRQFRLVRARPEALRSVGSWFERQQRHWSDAFDRLEAVIAAETPKRRKS